MGAQQNHAIQLACYSIFPQIQSCCCSRSHSPADTKFPALALRLAMAWGMSLNSLCSTDMS